MTEVIMLSILICCGISDLKDYKVKNCVIVFGWLYALFAGYMNLGIAGIKSAVLCITITILVGMPLFRIGGIGAGDIKLLSVIGGIYGMNFLANVTVLFIGMAGIVSFIYLVKKRAVFTRVCKFLNFARYSITTERYYEMKRDGKEFVIPLAPITALAYFIVLYLKQRGGMIF